MKLRYYPFATIGYIAVLPFVAHWIIRAWHAGGTDHD